MLDRIKFAPVELHWSDWYNWSDIIADARNEGIAIPNKKPGVYEVKRVDSEIRLTIGKASNLRMRIRQALVKGMGPHSSGKCIRANEDVAMLRVRWAETDRPAAVEEELHKRHKAEYGALPLYTKCT